MSWQSFETSLDCVILSFLHCSRAAVKQANQQQEANEDSRNTAVKG